MSDCFYYKGNERIDKIEDLLHQFFKQNFRLINASIFSKAEIQDSTYDTIKAIPGAFNYNKSNFEDATTFISSDHSSLYDIVDIKTKNGLLVPEYREPERIYSYVNTNKNNVNNLPDDVNITNVKYTPQKLEELKKHSNLPNLSENKLILLLSEIEEILEEEKKTTRFGTLLHNIISAKIQNKEYKGLVNTFLKKEENKDILGSGSLENWFRKIDQLTNEINTRVRMIGKPISEIFILSSPNSPVNTRGGNGIKGKIDLIAVDDKGAAHIFEIKISKTPYAKWDSAKKITLDWQLAIYRQLLGQHVDVNATMLYTIPIIMSSLGNPNKITLETIVNRKSESRSGLGLEGKITRDAEKLIPRKLFGDYDPERLRILKQQLHKTVEDYEVKTGLEDYNIDKIMQNAKARYEKEKVWRKWNNFEDIPGMKQGYIEADTEEEFRTKIEVYVKHVQTQTNRNVSILKDAIISALKTGSPIKTNSYNPKHDVTVNHIMKEYLNDEWDVVDTFPEAIALGLIILKNSMTGNVNVISLSVNRFHADSNIENVNYGDIEFLKTFLFLNMFKNELFPGGHGKVGQILAFNPIKNEVYYRTSPTQFRNFEKRIYETGQKDILSLTIDNMAAIEDIALYNLDVNLRKFNGSDKESMDVIFDKFRDTNLDSIDLDSLLQIQKDFLKKYPTYQDRTFEKGINFEDPKEVIFALLQVAIVSKKQMELAGDFKDMSKLSLGFSDFKSLLSALFTDNRIKYDSEGRKVQGMVQGLLWTTPDWVASKDLRNINQIVSISNQHIGEKMIKVSEILNKLTNTFYKSTDFSGVKRNVVGDSQSIHKRLWVLDGDTVSLEWKTKNPFILDNTNDLTEAESTYLKNILFYMNTWKEMIPDEEVSKIDPQDINSIKTNDILREKLEKGTYFKMPLVRREEFSKYKRLRNSTTPWKTRGKQFAEELHDTIDDRGLLMDDLSALEDQENGSNEMYNVFDRQSPEYIAKNLEKYSVNYFEWNLDTIAFQIAHSKIRKGVFDRSLPIINAYIWWMKLLAGRENADISNQLEYLKNQLGLSVYGKHIIDPEFKDPMKVAIVVKKISTFAMLAFRPALFIKEMIIGVTKGTSLAASKIYGKDQFGVKDLAAAYKKLMTIDNKFTNEFNLIDRLNHFYRFANMDANTIAEKTQTDRRGVIRGVGRYMYMMNTIPDYFNRLSLFLAKMIHDGSYEAHSLVDGVFIYDPRKDRRFAHYLKNRDKHKKDGQYIPATNDNLYNAQRRRYLLLLKQLQQEHGAKDEEYPEDRLIDKAYSAIERNSFKSFTDMAYGYYDKDAQTQSTNTWWGITWLQFMQFWQGKMKMWFATRTEDSPMGKIKHKFREDENGNKILQYHKAIEREDGSVGTIEVDEDTGDPVLVWEGTPYEGLYFSLIGTIKDIVKLDFKHLKTQEDRNNRAKFALADAAVMFMLFGIIKAILDSMLEENGAEGFSGTVLNMSSAINKKVLNEYNIYQSTLGAINTEPVFLAWSKKTAGDIYDVLTGDKDLTYAATRNFGALEPFKWIPE